MTLSSKIKKILAISAIGAVLTAGFTIGTPDGRKTKIFHTTIFTLALFNSANKILLYKSMNLFTNGFSVFNL